MTATARILLVEDEPDIGDMLRLFFNWRGYEFFHACYGDEALDLAARCMPHLILMDIGLPDTDGYLLTLKLRSRLRTAHIPIIFVTKWTSRERRLKALALGVEDYLTKPFDLEELLLRVQNSIARAAREYFTDLRTGFPAAFTVRERLAEIRTDPAQAIIEVTLEHGNPYRAVYGSAAGAEVIQQIGQLLLSVLNSKGSLDDFIGYLDEDHFILTTATACALAIAEQIAAVFNHSVARFYSEADQQRGAMLDGGTTFPFMHLLCRVTSGETRFEVS